MKYLLDGEQTARLAFRTSTPADFNAWLPFFNNPAIYPFLFLDAAMTPRELCIFWFDKIFRGMMKAVEV